MRAATSMGEIYILAVDGHQEATVWGLRALAAAGPGPVVVHCHSGKDRTGIAAGLLLSLAGVPDTEVAADYARSAERLRAYHRLYPADGAHEAAFVRETPPENMLRLLAHLHARYGGAAAYLRAAGLAEDEIAALRARLCPTPEETP
jgi:protein tyrosine/serine phosphatase